MFEVRKPVTPEAVANLIIAAFEGGSNYWIDKVRHISGNSNEKPYYADPQLYMDPDFLIEITDNDEEDRWNLNQRAIVRGLDLLGSVAHGRHLADFLSENDDAETADVFLQLCLFGDVVYG